MAAANTTAWVVVWKASGDWITKRLVGLPLALALLSALGCGRSSRSGVPNEDPMGDPGGTAGTPGTSGGSAGQGEGARAGGAGASGGTTMTGSSSVSLDGTPIYTRVQRLTVQQWEHAVTDILRFEATANLSAGFETPVAGAADFTNNERLLHVHRQRLQQHFDSIRDIEVGMGGMGNDPVERCSLQGLDVPRLEAYRQYTYDRTTTTEETLRLHMSLVALAFACNYRRTATIQWGDGYDATIYDVPSNPDRNRFSWICHRVQSDGLSGPVIPNAEQAHAEIDAVRMQSLAAGLDHFKARGLEDQCFVMWTNHFLDGPAHNFRNIPHIIWGSAGGYLKQGELIDLGGVTNNRLHNTLISAAIQDTGTTVEDFGDVATGGQLDAILA